MNLIKLIQQFPTQESCIKHLEKVRWSGKPKCPYCDSKRSSKGVKHYWNCMDCNNGYSVTVGTIFHNTNLPLQKWLFAVSLILNAKKGISGLQVMRDLKVSYSTAWRMLRLIRTAMKEEKNEKYFKAIVEMDETYLGGKPARFAKSKRGRGTKKHPVIGVFDRKSRQVYAKVAMPDVDGKKLTSKQILNVLYQVSISGTTVMTDEFTGYNGLKRAGFKHKKVNHQKEFVIGDIHTNNLESFWAVVKRGYYGVYHNMSLKYLQNYINEFVFRFNHRDVLEQDFVFGKVISNAVRAKISNAKKQR